MELYGIFLSSLELRDRLMRGEHLGRVELIIILENELRRKHWTVTDHIHENQVSFSFPTESCPSHRKFLLHALTNLTESIHFGAGGPVIGDRAFQSWQAIITRVMPATLLAWKGQHLSDSSHKERLKKICSGSLLPRPTCFPDLLKDLVETHLHLNGTTEGDFLWVEALNSPQNALAGFNKLRRFHGRIDPQYNLLFPGEPHSQLLRSLWSAKLLREILWNVAWKNKLWRVREARRKPGDEVEEKPAPLIVTEGIRSLFSPLFGLQNLERLSLKLGARSYSQHPTLKFSADPHAKRELPASLRHPRVSPFDPGDEMAAEMEFLIECFNHLRDNTCEQSFVTLLHIYLMLGSSFYRLVVQQVEQSGFGEFLKIVRNDIRTHSEDKSYAFRFKQLLRDEEIKILEGRFAPKKNVRRNLQILKEIEKGFIGKEEPKVKFALTAHWPKALDAQPYGSCRYARLRNENDTTASVLLQTKNRIRWHASGGKYPGPVMGPVKKPEPSKTTKLLDRIHSIDAAAHELHTPPEVYAPLFRRIDFLMQQYFGNEPRLPRTYHVGEDFLHLLSGMRSIYEAATFLKLRNGDRLGHATAIGLDPLMWIKRTGPSVILPKGEWLDNLVFASILLPNEAPRWREEIRRLEREVYGTDHLWEPSLEELADAWRMRGVDARFISQVAYSRPFLGAPKIDHKEWMEVARVARTQPAAFKLLKAYHSQKLRARYEAQLIVGLEEQLVPVFKQLQEKVLGEVIRRGVTIESMPSSNVRIGVYQAYEEHHLKRWLIEWPKLKVCLGSDDPGIFATCLHNEYAHVVFMLRAAAIPEDKIRGYVRRMKKTAQEVTFAK